MVTVARSAPKARKTTARRDQVGRGKEVCRTPPVPVAVPRTGHLAPASSAHSPAKGRRGRGEEAEGSNKRPRPDTEAGAIVASSSTKRGPLAVFKDRRDPTRAELKAELASFYEQHEAHTMKMLDVLGDEELLESFENFTKDSVNTHLRGCFTIMAYKREADRQKEMVISTRADLESELRKLRDDNAQLHGELRNAQDDSKRRFDSMVREQESRKQAEADLKVCRSELREARAELSSFKKDDYLLHKAFAKTPTYENHSFNMFVTAAQLIEAARADDPDGFDVKTYLRSMKPAGYVNPRFSVEEAAAAAEEAAAAAEAAEAAEVGEPEVEAAVEKSGQGQARDEVADAAAEVAAVEAALGTSGEEGK